MVESALIVLCGVWTTVVFLARTGKAHGEVWDRYEEARAAATRPHPASGVTRAWGQMGRQGSHAWSIPWMGYGAARRGDAYRPNAWSCVWSALDAVEVEVPETPKWPTLTLHDMPHYLGRLL